MSHSNIRYKPNKINEEQKQALKEKLNNPHNGIVGFIELLDWYKRPFNPFKDLWFESLRLK